MSLDINLTNVESTTNKKTTLTDNSDTFYPTQKAVKTAVDLKVNASDFSSHSVLAKQSGAGSPVAVTIGTNEILGRLSGGGSNIEGLSTSQVKTLLDLAGTNTGDQTLSGLGGVPTTRTITINGTTQDLSADRTFTVGNPFPLFGAGLNNITGANTTRFFAFLSLTANAAENQRQIIVPYAVTFKNFFCFFGVGASQPSTGSLVLTIRKNGVDTAITITIPAGTSSGTFSDTTNSESFAAGDLISVKGVNNSLTNSGNITSISLGTI